MESVKKKRKKVLPTIISIILIAIIIYILCYIRVPGHEVNPTNLQFGAGEKEKSFIIKNVSKKKGIFGVFNFGVFNVGIMELKYKIDVGKNDSCLSVYPASGSIGDDKETINVNIDQARLSIGSNKGVINIKTDVGITTIAVTAIRGEDKITITSPSPNASFNIGQESTIRWKSTFGVFDFVNIYLILNECVVENIANYYQYRKDDVSPGEFKWELGKRHLPGGEGYTIRVEDAQNSDIFDEIFPVAINYQITSIQFKNVSAVHQTPSTVQYIFSLRDQFNHAVIFNPSKIDWNTLKIWENEEEIDYLEGRAFLSSQEDFLLQVMLVLDFSASMKENKNGIETMVKGANSLIDSLKETHKIGVIEFHRPQTRPSILQPFVTNKNAAKKSIADFASNSIYSDFSICWDAVHIGLGQFPSIHEPKVFRALVFLSDGFDNSSFSKPKEIISLAQKRNVHIYNIGVGKVHEEQVLEDISGKTGGTYVHAEKICVLLERFQQIIRDLGGQYKLSYITPKKPKDGIFTMKSEITFKGVTSSPPLKGQIDTASVYGDTLRGVLAFSSSPVIKNKEKELILRCEYTPRYIHEFHFNLGKIKPYTISLISSEEGGLCENWKVANEGNGWYRLTSTDPTDSKYDLEFGAYGTICKFVVKGIKEDGAVFPFKLDNSVYSLGQSFYGGSDSEIDENGNWNTEIKVVPSKDGPRQ